MKVPLSRRWFLRSWLSYRLDAAREAGFQAGYAAGYAAGQAQAEIENREITRICLVKLAEIGEQIAALARDGAAGAPGAGGAVAGPSAPGVSHETVEDK